MNRVGLLALEGDDDATAPELQALEGARHRFIELLHLLVEEDPDCLESELCGVSSPDVLTMFGLAHDAC
jgi:hypothetical protein